MAAILIATAAPSVTVDLTPIIMAFIGLITLLVTAGFFSTRYQKRLQTAQADKAQAEAKLADGKSVLTHAQYEGFISEAAQRLETVNQATLSRLETELAKSQTRLAELQADLEKAKADRNEALAGATIRERELQSEIAELRRRVLDLERRLEQVGAHPRRVGDQTTTQIEAELLGRRPTRD